MFSGIDFVCIDYDIALSRLTENFRQTHHRHQSRLQDIVQYIARPDGRKLILVTDQNQSGSHRNRLQQRMHQLNIHHRYLIDDNHIGLQRILLIPFKIHLIAFSERIMFTQVDRSV